MRSQMVKSIDSRYANHENDMAFCLSNSDVKARFMHPTDIEFLELWVPGVKRGLGFVLYILEFLEKFSIAREVMDVNVVHILA